MAHTSFNEEIDSSYYEELNQFIDDKTQVKPKIIALFVVIGTLVTAYGMLIAQSILLTFIAVFLLLIYYERLTIGNIRTIELAMYFSRVDNHPAYEELRNIRELLENDPDLTGLRGGGDRSSEEYVNIEQLAEANNDVE